MSLYVLCCLIVCIVSIFLVMHPKYEDGLVGRIALLCISIGSLIVVGEFMDGVEYDVNPTTLTVQLGLAVFLLRHVYRFNKWVKHGSFDWRNNEKDTPAHADVCPLLRANSKSKPRRKRNADPIKAGSGTL